MKILTSLFIALTLSACASIKSLSDCAPGQCPVALQLAVDDIIHGHAGRYR